MKINGLFVAVFLATASLLAAGQGTSPNQAASLSNDQSTSAYGNGTISPGNSNSPSRTLPGASSSNSGGPSQMNIAAYRFRGSSQVLLAGFQQQAGSSSQSTAGQSTAGQQSPSANSVGSAGTPQSPSPDTGNNAALQSQIDDALRNEPTLGASHVVSNVSDTGIELSGTVGSTKDKQTAERIAASFNGNRKMTDNIVITGAGHSDLAPNHPAMNNGGVGNTQNPATNPPKRK
jgi:osmotically-inducible protein OsmY